MAVWILLASLERARTLRHRRVSATVAFGALLAASAVLPETVAVRHAEGLVRGFLVLRAPSGDVLANGEIVQSSRGDRVTSRVVFRFRDGSIQDETAVFTESGRFRLVSDHLVQRGPSFPQPIDIAIDAAAGRVTVRDPASGSSIADEQMKLPEDLANGILFTLLKNIPPEARSSTVSMVAATPKPRLVALEITRDGEEPFAGGSPPVTATRFRVKVGLGGLAGLIAPLVGKQPPDTLVWILGGEAPGFVRSEGPLYSGGPIWRIDLGCPSPPPAFGKGGTETRSP